MKKNIFVSVITAVVLLLQTADVFAGDAALSWSPPAANVDGTVIDDLEGYRIYYGTESRNYDYTINVTKDATTYIIENLTEGVTYYFAVTAYDTQNNESGYSAEVFKQIVPETPPAADDTADGHNEPDTDAGTHTDINNDTNADTDTDLSTDACSGTCLPSIHAESVLLSEDFADGIPEVWEAYGAWNTANACGRSIAYPFVAPYAIADSACGVDGYDELVTGVINAALCENAALVFSSSFDRYNGSIEVDISDDDGSAWTNVLYIEADDGNPAPVWKDIDIDRIAGSENARIRFAHVNNSGDGFWALDNVWVTCTKNEIEFEGYVDIQSEPQTVMVTNTGDGDLAVNMITTDGPDAAAFSVGEYDDCSGRTLISGESCIFDVVFFTSSLGWKDASLVIQSNDPEAPDTVIPLLGRARLFLKTGGDWFN